MRGAYSGVVQIIHHLTRQVFLSGYNFFLINVKLVESSFCLKMQLRFDHDNSRLNFIISFCFLCLYLFSLYYQICTQFCMGNLVGRNGFSINTCTKVILYLERKKNKIKLKKNSSLGSAPLIFGQTTLFTALQQ